ncbi:MAG: hypothetical protein IPI58_05065 [Alphaproteobacteria bacterium]|nr:MAG: hypothetical protein IPI58_05065 [Alphaproteobacteria bacterium]
MLKKTIIGFMLALFAGPLSAHAEMPGQPCTAAQIGTTKMADDKQNIIACLETGKAAPENVQEWKAMTSSGGGGLTGGCTLAYRPGDRNRVGSSLYVQESWGMGCRKNGASVSMQTTVLYGSTACNSLAAQGYECGISEKKDGLESTACLCVKK